MAVIEKNVFSLKDVFPVLSVSQLQGCLGMQVVACGASVFNILFNLVKVDSVPPSCWHYYYENTSFTNAEICHVIQVSCNSVTLMS